MSAQPRSIWGADTTGIDQTLRASLQQHKIPHGRRHGMHIQQDTYSGAFGKRDSASGVDVTLDSIFVIASMTKPITSVAAMQLVEQGKLKLDEPASTYIKELGSLQVLQGFDPKTGKPILKPATKPVTLRTLLTHTSGFVYDTWFADMLRWEKETGNAVSARHRRAADSADVRARIALAVRNQRRLERPTGGNGERLDAGAIFPEEHPGTAGHARHQLPASGREIRPAGRRIPTGRPDGPLKENPRKLAAPPKAFNGGGGLYSTAPDYVRFMQMILRRGKGRMAP